jgi:hypothetical protein
MGSQRRRRSRALALALVAAALAGGCGGGGGETAETDERPAGKPTTTAEGTTTTVETSEPSEDLVEYGTAKAGFRVSLPSNWQVLEGRALRDAGIAKPIMLYAVSPGYLEAAQEGRLAPSFSVSSVRLPPGVTFADYRKGNVARFGDANPQARDFRHGVVTLPAGKALEYTYTKRSDLGTLAAFRQYGFIIGRAEWVLVFETSPDTFDSDVELFEQVAQSFRAST